MRERESFRKTLEKHRETEGNEFDFFSADFSRLILVDEREKNIRPRRVSLSLQRNREI